MISSAELLAEVETNELAAFFGSPRIPLLMCGNSLILKHQDEAKLDEAIEAYRENRLLSYFLPEPILLSDRNDWRQESCGAIGELCNVHLNRLGKHEANLIFLSPLAPPLKALDVAFARHNFTFAIGYVCRDAGFIGEYASDGQGYHRNISVGYYAFLFRWNLIRFVSRNIYALHYKKANGETELVYFIREAIIARRVIKIECGEVPNCSTVFFHRPSQDVQLSTDTHQLLGSIEIEDQNISAYQTIEGMLERTDALCDWIDEMEISQGRSAQS